jgi:flagellar biosynthetic protein FliR
MPAELVAAAFSAFLVFARVGAMIMLLPGLGEPGVPPRARLGLALLISMALAPGLAPMFPSMPSEPIPLAGLIITEVLIGLAFGAALRMTLAAISVAGQVIAMQTGLAMAMAFDPSQGQQGTLLSAFLNITAIAFLFATGLHQVFLAGVRGVFMLVPPGSELMLGDFAELGLSTFARTFMVGMQIAAPLIVFGLVFYMTMGVLSRLMPQAQIFFIAMPSTILLGLTILAATLGAGLIVWSNFARDVAMSWV